MISASIDTVLRVTSTIKKNNKFLIFLLNPFTAVTTSNKKGIIKSLSFTPESI